MNLSQRLQAVADLIGEDMTVADVGTDHGYIPIYLIETGKSNKVLAMDINPGPLLRATENIHAHGLDSQIETRLSNGVSSLRAGEVDCVVIAGMGGALTIRILENGEYIFKYLHEFILQPQSEITKVRQYLCENGYQILAENMILEDGKYYPMMKVIKGAGCSYTNIELAYGPCLLKQQHPVLRTFLEQEVMKRENMLRNLRVQSGKRIQIRTEELSQELEEMKYALQRYYSND